MVLMHYFLKKAVIFELIQNKLLEALALVQKVPEKTIFLDRDGVINKDLGYISRI